MTAIALGQSQHIYQIRFGPKTKSAPSFVAKHFHLRADVFGPRVLFRLLVRSNLPRQHKRRLLCCCNVPWYEACPVVDHSGQKTKHCSMTYLEILVLRTLRCRLLAGGQEPPLLAVEDFHSLTRQRPFARGCCSLLWCEDFSPFSIILKPGSS